MIFKQGNFWKLQKALKTKNEVHIKKILASFCRKYILKLKLLNKFDTSVSRFTPSR